VQNIEHNGYTIKFSDEREEWWTTIKSDEGEETISDSSLKKMRQYIDKLQKKTFKRIPIFVHVNRYRSGSEVAYLPRYGQATITSVSPNGNAYYVEKGRKHSSKEGLRYCYLYEDTPENREAIAEYERCAKEAHEANLREKKAGEKIKRIDGSKLFKSIYGRDL
jgi:hypothetical protein